MTKQAKRPGWPYSVVDAYGHVANECATIKIARLECAQNDRDLPPCSPHRVYVLVTLKEREIVRLAKKYVLATQEARVGYGTQCAAADAWVRLENAVEAASGK